MDSTAPVRQARRTPVRLAIDRTAETDGLSPKARKTLSQAHLRLLKALAFSKDWVDCETLCLRARISTVEIARVYICEIRNILKTDVEIVTKRTQHRRGLYFMTYLDPAVLPRCPKCNEIL